MKKLFAILTISFIVFTVHAQSTVVVVKQDPGFLGGLVNAATSIVAAPFYLGAGILEGTAEALSTTCNGSTSVVVVKQPQAVVTAPPPPPPQPAVVVPPPTTVVAPAAVVVPATVPTTTITTRYSDGSIVQVTRQASAYELGPNVVVPVAPNHRVGTSPFANPYVYRPR